MKLALRYSASPYKEWKSRATISITNPASTEGYEHKLALTYIATMNTDFSDIRFAQTDGKKCLYWIEPDTLIASTSCTVWIKVPAAGQTTIYMYYNNPVSKSESDGSRVFTRFDEFNGTTISQSWITTGDVTISGGVCTLKYQSGIISYIISADKFSTNYAIRSRVKTAHVGNNDQSEAIGFINYGGTLYQWWARLSWSGAGKDWYQYDGAGATTAITTWVADTYYTIDLIRNGSTSDIGRVNDGDTKTLNTHVPTQSLNICARASSGIGARVDIKWIALRKYTATEPTLAVV